jgi:hypothetical protein
MLASNPKGLCAARAIPARYQPAPPLPKPSGRSTEGERQEYHKLRRSYNLSTIGRDAIAATRRQLDAQEGGQARVLVIGVDGSYTNQTVLRGLPERTTLIGRIRQDAHLFHPVESTPPADRGRPRQYGSPLPTPKALAGDPAHPWQPVRAFAAGNVHEFRVKTLATVLWAKAGPKLPLRLIVIAPLGYRLRKGQRLLYRQAAYLICTDPDMPVEQAVQDYLWRWGIEVDHRDEKQLIGVGEAQVRCLDSARREPTFAVACYAKLLLAAAQRYGPDATQGQLPLPKWRRNRPPTRLTTGDLVRQIRQDLWGEALRQVERNYSHFVNATGLDMNGPKFEFSLRGAIDHAATG